LVSKIGDSIANVNRTYSNGGSRKDEYGCGTSTTVGMVCAKA